MARHAQGNSADFIRPLPVKPVADWLQPVHNRLYEPGRLTPEERRAISAELDHSWEQSSQDRPKLLEMWRIETLVAMRQAFRKLAEAQGWL